MEVRRSANCGKWVSNIALQPIHAISTLASLREVCAAMATQCSCTVPLAKNGEVVGQVYLKDLIEAMLDEENHDV